MVRSHTPTVEVLQSLNPFAKQLWYLPRGPGRLSAVPMDDRTDMEAILLRRKDKAQLWLDFGITLTDLPHSFKPRQMVNVTGTMETGYHLLATSLMHSSLDALCNHVQRYELRAPNMGALLNFDGSGYQ